MGIVVTAAPTGASTRRRKSSEVRVGRPPSRRLPRQRRLRDRNRLTAGGISSGVDEARELIRLLQGTEAAQYFLTVNVTG
jgi:transcriptional regulator GlxA family with amidase domain